MIAAMLSFETIILIFLSLCYNSIPIWLRIVLQACVIVTIAVAYGSEETLRNKVRRLEEKLEKYKKGGTE